MEPGGWREGGARNLRRRAGQRKASTGTAKGKGAAVASRVWDSAEMWPPSLMSFGEDGVVECWREQTPPKRGNDSLSYSCIP